jgi:hypothetical protein
MSKRITNRFALDGVEKIESAPFDAFARLSFRLLAEPSENLVETVHLDFGFLEVGLEGVPQILGRGSVGNAFTRRFSASYARRIFSMKRYR